jgi:DNA invertase Pin-like site-specific DNA recombinase
MKAAVYGRVSTNRQETENQLREIRAYCERKGWTIVDKRRSDCPRFSND